jgi:hypothetical protein
VIRVEASVRAVLPPRPPASPSDQHAFVGVCLILDQHWTPLVLRSRSWLQLLWRTLCLCLQYCTAARERDPDPFI